MKNLVFVLLVVLIASCNNNTELVADAVGSEPKVLDTTKDNASLEESKPFSNPAIIYGSDFGNFFRTLYKQGKYDDMIKFTSKESLELHGEDVVRNFYKNKMKFGYEIGKPHSQNVEGDVTTLNYNGNIIATKTVIRISVKLENDSCKIVLPKKLKRFPS